MNNLSMAQEKLGSRQQLARISDPLAAHVAQALMPAVSRFVSTRFRGLDAVSKAGVGMSADAAGMSACATSWGPRSCRHWTVLLVVLFACRPAAAQTGFPFQDESLRYSVNWPSGLSLGEATFSAHHVSTGWGFEASLDAGIPGFSISDKFGASATTDLCSLEFVRNIGHGAKKTRERTTFDQRNATAHRVTVLPADGGITDFDIPPCARDALTFVYLVRREMGQGRVAPAQKLFFGAGYSVSLQYTGAVNIPVAGKQVVTDHLVASLKGPKADSSIEIFFARDAARTPLLIKIPVSVGTLSVELVR